MSETINEPKVSVIVPCYNHGRFLDEALNSVLNQTFGDWECIVIDNGSTDDTKEIVQKIIGKDKRVSYLFHEKRGVAAARNFGISKSRGKYILPLDADDKITNEYLNKAVKILEADSSVKIVYCEAELFGDASGKWNLPEFSMKNILRENSIFCSALYRKSDFEKTKGYDQDLSGFEDWDFWLTLLENGGEVYRIPEVLFYYRIQKSSRNNSLDNEKQRFLRKQIYLKHKALYDEHLNLSDVLFDWYNMKEVLNAIKKSKEYKFSKKIFSPFRKLKSWFSGSN